MAGTSIANLKAMLTLDTSKWMSGFASAGKSAQSFVGGIGSQLGTAVAGFVSVGAAIHSLGQGMEQVDRQAKLADRLGIAVGEVQKLALAADLAGTNVEVLAKGMLKMGKNIGSGGQSLDIRLFQVADSIAKITDAGERAKKAEDIFGKGGLELINTLAQGSRGIRASAEAIDRFDLAISRIDAAKIEAANDAFTEMKTVLGGLRNQFAVDVAPTITSAIQTWMIGLEGLVQAHHNLKESMGGGGGVFGTGATFYEMLGASIYAGGGVTDELLKTMADQRNDVARNMMNAGRQSGAGLLGKTGGGLSAHFASGAAEKGTVEAGRLIQGAKFNQPNEAEKKTVALLEDIKKNTRKGPGPDGSIMRARM